MVAIAFFVFELYLLLNSFGADYRIYQDVAAGIASRGFSFRPLFWLFSELVGEVGLIVRFAGACFFLFFTLVFFRKKELSLVNLRKGVFLEAVQYLFFVPFILYLFTNPNGSMVAYEAATSYTLQILLITPVLLTLYKRLKNPTVNRVEIVRWLAIGITSFVFALWVKHFIFNLYALPIDFNDPILVLGLLNSSLTLLLAAAGLLVTFLPAIRGKSVVFNSKTMGISLILIGVYFIVYVGISLLSPPYLSYLTLTELWAVTMPIIGLSFLRE